MFDLTQRTALLVIMGRCRLAFSPIILRFAFWLLQGVMKSKVSLCSFERDETQHEH